MTPFSPRNPLTLGPRNPETLETIDTLIPTTSTGHLKHSEAGMGEGELRGLSERRGDLPMVASEPQASKLWAQGREHIMGQPSVGVAGPGWSRGNISQRLRPSRRHPSYGRRGGSTSCDTVDIAPPERHARAPIRWTITTVIVRRMRPTTQLHRHRFEEQHGSKS